VVRSAHILAGFTAALLLLAACTPLAEQPTMTGNPAAFTGEERIAWTPEGAHHYFSCVEQGITLNCVALSSSEIPLDIIVVHHS
jgi:hypothetical protein